MTKTKNFTNGISNGQYKAMTIVQKWSRENKEPIPKRELFKQLIIQDMPEQTINQVIRALLRDGYIRRSVVSKNGKMSYVQIKSIAL